MSAPRGAPGGSSALSRRVSANAKDRARAETAAEGRADAKAGEARPRRKARGLLRAFYGLQDAASDAQAKEKRKDPLDIDGPAFEPDRYVARFLKEADVAQLIQKDNDLITAVKTLDGEMKTLVYENYNKFITATDTIRKIKDTVDSMEAEMDGLTAQIEKISQKSTALNDALGERRGKVRQLHGVHSVLQKLQFIFDLPNRLQEHLVNGQLPQAVRLYARTSKIFNQYRDLAVFKSIESECQEIMMGVATTIEARIKAASSTASIVEATELLLGLGRAPKEMWTAMIQAEAKHLGQVKTACLQAMVGLKERAKKDGTSSTAPDGSEDTQIVLAVDLVNERYLADLARFATGFEELFLQPAGGTVAAGPTATSITAKPSTSVAPSANTSPTEALPATTRSGTSSSTLPRTRTDRILPTLTPEERNEARQALRTALTGPISDYFAMVSDTLGSPLDIFELDTINFGVVLGAVQRAAALYPSLCRHGELDDEARRFCFTRVRRTVNSLFTRANRDALDRFIPLWTVDPASPPDLAKFVGEAVSYLDFLLNTKVFTVVSSIFSPPNSTGFADGFPDGRVEFLEIVRVELRLFWLDLLQGLLHYSSPHYFQGDGPRHPSVKHTDPPPAVVTLAMVRYCIDLPVRAIYETFAGLWGRKKDATQPDSWSKVRRVVTDGNAGEEVMLDAKDVAESAETKCGELAALYAANAADQVSAPLAGYLGWRSEWTGARPAVESCSDAVVETIRLVSQQDREIAQFFPDPERSKSGAPSPYLAGPSRSTASLGFAGRGLASSPSLVGRPNIPPIRTDRALLSNIDKLFAEEEEWYTPTFKPGHRTLVSTVVKLALKNWVELVRRQTFGKDGFQQLQTDAEIARFGLWKYNWNERGYNSLVDEIIGSAAARSVQVEYVDSVKLGKLVTAFESQGVGAMRG